MGHKRTPIMEYPTDVYPGNVATRYDVPFRSAVARHGTSDTFQNPVGWR